VIVAAAPSAATGLRRPAAFPDRPRTVEVRETHMSRVFLTERFAYKLKKPLRYALLDHRTVEQRRRACREELRLNRRLARTVYLDVLPVVQAEDGLRIGGTGPPVDWVVRMRRLADDRMLDRKIADGTLRPGEHRGVAALLARFYRDASPVPTDGDRHREGLVAELLSARHELVDPRHGLPAADIDAAADAVLRVLGGSSDPVGRRVREGRVVEGHGDLRPEHVALGPVPAVIDCLEFSRDLRILDPADELAYLGLECERLGAPLLRAAFMDEYARLTGDRPPLRLVEAYAVLRALVRAKLAVWHAREPEDHAERWLRRAADYVSLGRERSRRLTAPARAR
jgi:aminoglycoside phosphotransferase family enzyme